MAALNKLTSPEIKSLKSRKISDGGGLWFHRRKDGGGQWFQRFTLHGVRHEMGLGSIEAVSLKEARAFAEGNRALVRQGINPMKERDRLKQEAARNIHSLREIAVDAFESRKAELRNEGKSGQWFAPLENHILPRLGRTPVSEIDQKDIRDTLAPIWHTKADTAKKAINRLGICMRHAAALGLEVDLQAVDKAKALLGRQRHVVTNVPALHWKRVPAFYEAINEENTTQLALRLLILTALRSKPVRFARLDQIDNEVWTIPAENMKGRKDAVSDFRVPLSKEALQVVAAASKFERDGFLFPSVRKGVISDATMARFMERRGMIERPHGFRSSFRTWCAEATETPRDLAETCLGHVVGSGVERAYRRTDLLEKRAALMERWAGHVAGGSGEVVRIAR